MSWLGVWLLVWILLKKWLIVDGPYALGGATFYASVLTGACWLLAQGRW